MASRALFISRSTQHPIQHRFGNKHASACEQHPGSEIGEKSTQSTWSELVERTGIPAFEAHLGCRGVQVGEKKSCQGFHFAGIKVVFLWCVVILAILDEGFK
jgi:hypothetical protein